MSCLHPGKTLLHQYMQPNALSQNKLAKTIGVPPRRINEIVLGKRAISADTAIRLGAYFGNSASYWMHIQAEFDIEIAREKLGQRLHMIQAAKKNPIPADSKPNNTIESSKNRNIKRRLMR